MAPSFYNSGTSVRFRVSNQSTCSYVYVTQATFEVPRVAFNSAVAVSPKSLIAIREHWLSSFRLAGDPVVPRRLKMVTRVRRASSRACHKDVRRWKRRKFLQEISK